jgi:serine/threonine protein kinase
MGHHDTFRELLIADLVVVLDRRRADAVSAFLERRWGAPDTACGSFTDDLARELDVPRAEIERLAREVDRLVVASRSGSGGPRATEDAGDAPRHAGPAPVATPPELRTMQRSRYREITPIAQGGMGAVYAAHDEDLHRRVALKTSRSAEIRWDDATDVFGRSGASPTAAGSGGRTPEREARGLLREARVTGGLEHPGVVPVYDIGRTPRGAPYYTMRYVEGERTLLSAIDEARSLEDRLALLGPFLQVCDTIRYAHSRGVLHRDLKPANIALGAFGEVLVLDWGLASVRDRENGADARHAGEGEAPAGEAADPLHAGVMPFDSRTRRMVGTPGYLAPEVALGTVAEAGERADVYSLGATLYHVLTGRPPFTCRSLRELRDKLGCEDPSAPTALDPSVPRGLSRIAMRALARSRDQRYGRVSDLADDIRSWQVASAIDREVSQLLDEAGTLLAGARQLSPEARLASIDRAAAICSRAEQLREGGDRARGLTAECEELRRAAVASRVRAARLRSLRRVGGVVLLLAAVTAGVVAWVVNDERTEALRQRQRANELASFMLSDLHGQLQTIGRLELLGSVAEKALRHFDEEPVDLLAAYERWQRAMALIRVGEVLSASGDLLAARAAYGRSRRHWRELVAELPDDPALRKNLALALRREGAALLALGDSDGAWNALDESERISRALARTSSNPDDHLGSVASALGGKADITARRGEIDAAIRLVETALGLLGAADTGREAPPRRDSLRVELLTRQGDLLDGRGDSGTGVVKLREAVAIARRRVSRAPHDTAWQDRVADALTELARLQEGRGEVVEALANESDALVIRSRLSARDPTNARRRFELARHHRRIGRLEQLRGDSTAALAECREAVRILDELVAIDATNTQWSSLLAAMQQVTGKLLERAGEAEAAVRLHERSVAIYRGLVSLDRTNSYWREGLATGLARQAEASDDAGRRDEAAALRDQAIPMLRAAVEARPDETRPKHALAENLKSRGAKRFVADDREGALAGYLEADRLLRELVERDPAKEGPRRTWADVARHVARVHTHHGELEPALEWERRCADRFGTLVESAPEGVPSASTWDAAAAHARIASLLRKSGDEPGADRAQHRADELWEKAGPSVVRDKRFGHEYAEALTRRAESEAGAGNLDDARALYEQALAVRREIVDEEPTEFAGWRALGRLAQQAADFEADTSRGRRRQAVELYVECAASQDLLLVSAPEDDALLEDAAFTRARWGTALRLLGDVEGALRVHREARALHARAEDVNPARAGRRGWYDRIVEEDRLYVGDREPKDATEHASLALWHFNGSRFRAAYPHFVAALADPDVRADPQQGALYFAACTAAELASDCEGDEAATFRGRGVTWTTAFIGQLRDRIAAAERMLETRPGDPDQRRIRNTARQTLEYVRNDARMLDPLRREPGFRALFEKQRGAR